MLIFLFIKPQIQYLTHKKLNSLSLGLIDIDYYKDNYHFIFKTTYYFCKKIQKENDTNILINIIYISILKLILI